ncbi:pyridine nucleotide-disulfide oxidoreductase domain-containing protein 2-like, partial [Nilaparvata lugens]|uniref:pyridine nucleotide-disulfide oxidoreductase domain-containing protein 2-like n=1 Tax=Nilaparvata lugens TaxID=108931 RepID=UPI00193CF4E6
MDLSTHTLMEEFFNRNAFRKILNLFTNKDLRNAALALSTMRSETRDLYIFLTTSISSILDEWFESEPLKATLATDALIGTMADCNSLCTGYGLLHHMMGNIDGRLGAWAYPEGGMGAVTQSIAKSAISSGAEIYVNKCVKSIVLDGSKHVNLLRPAMDSKSRPSCCFPMRLL